MIAMTRVRLDGLRFVLLGSIVFLLLGTGLAVNARVTTVDFRLLYYPARCLIHHGDPYNSSELLQMTLAESGSRPKDAAMIREILRLRFIYPPTAFSFLAPFAVMPWGTAHVLWMTLTVGGMIFASFLIWSLGADYSPVISGALIGLFLANGELLVVAGNMAGIAISLCAVAVWCFARGRYVPAGVLCLAIAVMIKPHDTGLVWLYFLLAGEHFRKWAMQSLMAAMAISLPGVLWVWHVAPHWTRELGANLLADSVRGQINDPGPSSAGAHGLGMMVNLQTVFSAFRDDPRFYNAATFALCGTLLLIWCVVTMRFRSSPMRLWLGLAVIAALSMLPFYHRQQDTMLLLLTVPGCVMLWTEGGRVGRLALLITVSCIVLIGDIPWIIFLNLIGILHVPATRLSQQILTSLQILPVPVILLATTTFYLWAYAYRCLVRQQAEQKPANA